RKNILVRLNFDCFWDWSDPPEQVSTDCHATRPKKRATSAKQTRTLDRSGLETKPLAENLGLLASVALNIDYAVTHNSDIRISGHSLYHASQLIACPPIITIQKRNDFAFALRNPGIEGRGLSAVRFTQQADARRKFSNNFRRPVGRPVIHNDDFPVRDRKILLQHAGNRMLDKSFVIVRVDED